MSGPDGPVTATDRARLLAIVDRHRGRDGPLLEILHDVQRAFGCVTPAVVAEIAAALNLSRAEVHGVVSFYHFFRDAPPGRRVLRLCRAEACQSMNGRALEEHAVRKLGIRCGETTPDGSVTLEAVYCLGLCACAPSAMLDDQVHGRMTPERLDELLADAGAVPS